MSRSKPLKAILGEEEYDGGDDEVTIEGPDLSADDPMRAFLPASFGKQKVATNVQVQFDRTRREPLDAPEKGKGKAKIPQPRVKPESEDEDEDEDDDDDNDDSDDEEEYPISHELVLKDHTKPVSSISLDPSGTRMVTGGHDYLVKFYDFPSMSSDHLRAFKSLEPSESHHVHSATFSHVDSGQSILVVPAAAQAKVLSRDGDTVVEFVKGDMYLRDMHNTKGHVSEITAGAWHPTDKNVLVTAGTDSTIRIWDVNAKRQHRDIMVHKSRTGKGGRSRMCCLAWAGRGGEGAQNMIGTVALDGVLAIYAGNGPYTRPVMEVRDAHKRDTWTGGIAFSYDGRMVVTRGQDQDIKLWDTRKLKTPISTRTSFPTPSHPEASIAFSPNSTNLITGDTLGNLHILSPATLRTEHTLSVTPGSPLIALTWHPKINHIITGSANGSVHILYSPNISTRGALLVVAKAPRKRHIDDDPSLTTDATAVSGDAVILPNAILGNQRVAAAAALKRGDPRRPNMPAVTPWGKSQPDQGHINRSIALSSMRDEDPREALLKYADAAEKDPIFTAAWRETQPKTIYAEVEEEEEEERKGGERKRFRKY